MPYRVWVCHRRQLAAHARYRADLHLPAACRPEIRPVSRARIEGHVYLPLGDLADRTARQLDERRASTGRWEPDPERVKAIRAYIPHFTLTEDARLEAGSSGDLAADDAHVYSRELYEAECLAAERLA